MPPGRRRRSEAGEPLTVEGKVRVAPALVRINYDNPRDARVARMAEKVLSQMLAASGATGKCALEPWLTSTTASPSS